LLILLAIPQCVLGQGDDTAVLVTLDADSTSVNDILQILAERSALNIVTSPEVQGRRISIHLTNTPFEEALNLVVRAAGLGYERVGNSILVADIQKLAAQTGFTTRVFDLHYANAEEIREVLEVISKDVTADFSGNRVAVRGSQSIVEQIEDIIARLDRKPGQVLLEARLVEVNTTDLLEIGIDWEKITKWSTVLSEGPLDATSKGEVPDQIPFIKADETADLYRQASTLEVVLDALITDGKARLLSSTKVVTLDNTPAEIFIGETVPVVITSLGGTGGAGGAFQTIQLEKIDVGIKLNITPRLSDDGFVTTLVEPEVSTIVGFVGPDDDLPQTSTRRARSLVRVRDGEKIYLGGLLTEQTRRTVKKVPVLGHIPLLGLLFQHRRDESIRTDLVIEITPTIVGDEGAALPVTPAMPDEGS
jgi:type II secretory pathway component GspD/PulD (secretin)